jgi:hypothetical protein
MGVASVKTREIHFSVGERLRPPTPAGGRGFDGGLMVEWS